MKEPMPRIRWLEPIVTGDPAVRVEITEFEVHTTGVFTGVTIRPQAQPPGMLGLTSIPRDVAGDALQYRVRLPLELLQEDPKLRIRWTIVDLDTGVTVRNEDGPADGRLTLEFVPALTGTGTTKFGISVRVYRTLGPEITEFLNEGIRLEVRAPNPPGTYVRWRYDVKNPQVRFDRDRDAWWYGSPSEAVVGRWSAIHRLDKPCRMANKRSRYTYYEERLDRLPFPLWQILDRRNAVCEYCFFGGPGKLLPFL
jgi:hypothetical protein